MEQFLLRLLIAVLVIVLVEYLLKALQPSDRAVRIILAVTVVICILFAIFGSAVAVIRWPF